MTTLIIEDGSIVPNANSYVTVAEVQAVADNQGDTLPETDDDVAKLVLKGMAWFEIQETNFPGSRVSADQSLSFPRKGVSLFGFPVADDTIPQRVKDVVIQATIVANTIDLLPNYAGTTKGDIQAEKVDVISRTYFKNTDYANRYPMLMKLEAMMEPLLTTGLGAGRLTTLRV